MGAPEMPEIHLRSKEGNLEMVDHKRNKEKQINFEHVVWFFFLIIFPYLEKKMQDLVM